MLSPLIDPTLSIKDPKVQALINAGIWGKKSRNVTNESDSNGRDLVTRKEANKHVNRERLESGEERSMISTSETQLLGNYSDFPNKHSYKSKKLPPLASKSGPSSSKSPPSSSAIQTQPLRSILSESRYAQRGFSPDSEGSTNSSALFQSNRSVRSLTSPISSVMSEKSSDDEVTPRRMKRVRFDRDLESFQRSGREEGEESESKIQVEQDVRGGKKKQRLRSGRISIATAFDGQIMY